MGQKPMDATLMISLLTTFVDQSSSYIDNIKILNNKYVLSHDVNVYPI